MRYKHGVCHLVLVYKHGPVCQEARNWQTIFYQMSWPKAVLLSSKSYLFPWDRKRRCLWLFMHIFTGNIYASFIGFMSFVCHEDLSGSQFTKHGWYHKIVSYHKSTLFQWQLDLESTTLSWLKGHSECKLSSRSRNQSPECRLQKAFFHRIPEHHIRAKKRFLGEFTKINWFRRAFSVWVIIENLAKISYEVWTR